MRYLAFEGVGAVCQATSADRAATTHPLRNVSAVIMLASVPATMFNKAQSA